MSALDSSLVDDVRALLTAFARDDLRQLKVKLRPGTELLLRREAPAPVGIAVTAPHVATLVECATEGQLVEAGDPAAVLDLLGERIEIAAPIAGVVDDSVLKSGALVQYGEPVVWLEKT